MVIPLNCSWRFTQGHFFFPDIMNLLRFWDGVSVISQMEMKYEAREPIFMILHKLHSRWATAHVGLPALNTPSGSVRMTARPTNQHATQYPFLRLETHSPTHSSDSMIPLSLMCLYTTEFSRIHGIITRGFYPHFFLSLVCRIEKANGEE